MPSVIGKNKMNIIEFSTLTIAILSFVLSCYVIFKDKKNRMYDLLHKCYERIHVPLDQKQPLTISEYIEMEENPDSEETEKRKTENDHASSIVNRELDFACYLVLDKQIKLNLFFDIFGGYLAGRLMQLETPKLKYKIINKKYLCEVIDLCKKKKLLPLKNNKKIKKAYNKSIQRTLTRR